MPDTPLLPETNPEDPERAPATAVDTETVTTALAEGGAVSSICETSPAPQPAPGETAPPVSSKVAEPFVMVSSEDAFARAKSVSVADVRAWLEKPREQRRMLFDEWQEECGDVAIVRNASAVPPLLWVVGDLHADVLALANIIAHADRVAQTEKTEAAYLFLGDFVDRGRHDHETLLLLFQLAMTRPGRVCVIPGNHDLDLAWDDSLQKFRVSIEPAEYCEWLNGLLVNEAADCEEVELARLFIRFCQERPKAVFLADGTLYSHGGFPHTDTHMALSRPEHLSDPRCLSDFLWARISESPRKRPNRGNRGHEFGWRDFAQFCQVMTDVVKLPVCRLIRGHDHYLERWRYHADYAEMPVLTLNAMGRLMEGETATANGHHPLPVMARHRRGQLPEVVVLPLVASEVDRAFELSRESPAHAIEEFLAPSVELAPPEKPVREGRP
jgi:hypothetical protein